MLSSHQWQSSLQAMSSLLQMGSSWQKIWQTEASPKAEDGTFQPLGYCALPHLVLGPDLDCACSELQYK